MRPFQKIWTLIFWYAPTLRLLYILSSLIDVWLRSRFSHTPIYIIIIGHIDTPMICRRFLYNHMHVFFCRGGYFFIQQCFAHGLVMKRTEVEAKHYRIIFFRVDHMELWGGYVCVWLLFNSLFLFDNIFFLFHGFITFANNFLFTFMLFLWLTLVALFRKKEHASRDKAKLF